ncbi:MAG: SRPBCC domain-containing protein [Actinomycetota bacterium]|nr:SRPBCC domain-containing protein [Actinomycetota bacterium]
MREDPDIADLWSAVTEPTRLARWDAAVEGDLRVGGTFHAEFTSTWEGPGHVEVCDAPNHILLTMEPGADVEAVIEATLTAEGQRMRLVVEERGLPLDALHLHGAGWQAHFDDLARYLAGSGSAWKARWQELTPAYEALDLP